MFLHSSVQANYLTISDAAGNGGQFRDLHIRGVDNANATEVNLNQILLTAANVTVNGSFNCVGDINTGVGRVNGAGYMCRYGYNGSLGNVFNWWWNSDSHMYCFVDSTNMGWVAFNSDYRIKKDVAPLPSMWDRVKALRPISYTHCDFTPPIELEKNPDAPLMFHSDDDPYWGFIAHELQETLITSAASGVKDAPDQVQAPNPWVVIAALTKALQESMGRVESLEARMTALGG
jgi:hypothetical protein